jgi:hypothetical protein
LAGTIFAQEKPIAGERAGPSSRLLQAGRRWKTNKKKTTKKRKKENENS